MITSRWNRVLILCALVAASSLLSNVALPPEMAGQWPAFSFVRKSVSKLLNSGTVWAGVAIVAGWIIRRPLWSSVAGTLAAVATLLLHYVSGLIAGMFTFGVFADNQTWFVAAVVLCAPLGFVGWLASRPGWLGLAARLVLPVGAVAEPWVRRMFEPWPEMPWPERYADVACGVALIALAVASALVVLRCGRRGLTRPPAAA